MTDIYVVKKGDTLLSIFRQLCLWDFDVIWDHADNQKVRDAYEKHGELTAGDTFTIPKQATTLELEANKHHTIVLKAPKAQLVLLLESPKGLALRNSKYELHTGNRTVTGVTDGDGVLREVLPMTLKHAVLHVTPAQELREQATSQCRENDTPDCAAEVYEWRLVLGTPPAEDLAGFQSRLNNLGYAIGASTGESDASTEAAIEAFQVNVELLILIGGTTQPINLGADHGSDNDSDGDNSQGHSDTGVAGGTDYWGLSLADLAKRGLEDVDWYWQKDADFRATLASMEKRSM